MYSWSTIKVGTCKLWLGNRNDEGTWHPYWSTIHCSYSDCVVCHNPSETCFHHVPRYQLLPPSHVLIFIVGHSSAVEYRRSNEIFNRGALATAIRYSALSQYGTSRRKEAILSIFFKPKKKQLRINRIHINMSSPSRPSSLSSSSLSSSSARSCSTFCGRSHRGCKWLGRFFT